MAGRRAGLSLTALKGSALMSVALLLVGCNPGGPGARTGSVDMGGTRARYVIEGSGRPCLFIGSRIYYPKTVSAEFRDHLKCVFLDLPHFIAGAPGPDDGSYGVESAVQDIETARARLGLDDFVLIGHSIHGLMAIAYAQRFPGHAGHVIAIGAPPRFDDSLNTISETFWDEDASPERKAAHGRNLDRAGELPEGFDREAVVRGYVAHGAMYWFNPAYDATWLWDGVEVNEDLFRQLFGEPVPFDLRNGPVPIQTPVLVILGRFDYVVPYTLWNQETDLLGHGEIRIFERSGHTPQLEEPDRFDRTVIDWLAEN